MDFWTAVVSIVGAGGVGATLSILTTFWLSKNKQPIEFYQQLINNQEKLNENNRIHLQNQIDRIEKEHKDCMERHIESVRIQGEQAGRLFEQGRQITSLTRMFEESAVNKLIHADNQLIIPTSIEKAQ